MINLGLNRKISNVLSKNLNDPESEIYKEISSIAGETTESDSSVNNPFGINIAECIEENKEPFDDCDLESIEELYLLNATSISGLPMERFTSLKKLMLPNLNPSYVNNYIDLDNAIANLPIEIMLLKGSIADGGMFNCNYSYPTFNSLETLVLTNCSSIGHTGLRKDHFPNLNNLVLLNKEDYVMWSNTTELSQYNNNIYIYVPDSMIDTYVEHDEYFRLEDHLKPLSELPYNLKKELELCQIQI